MPAARTAGCASCWSCQSSSQLSGSHCHRPERRSLVSPPVNSTFGRLRITYLKRVTASSGVIDSRADKSRSVMTFQCGTRPADRVICVSAPLSLPSSARLLQRWPRLHPRYPHRWPGVASRSSLDGHLPVDLRSYGQCVTAPVRRGRYLAMWQLTCHHRPRGPLPEARSRMRFLRPRSQISPPTIRMAKNPISHRMLVELHYR
jgi:hypothetical protein